MPAYLRDPLGGGSSALLADPFSPLALHVVSATVNAASTQITLVLSEAVEFGASGAGGFQTTPTAIFGAGYSSGSNTNTLVLTLSIPLRQGQGVTLAYTQPGDGWKAVDDGELLASFSGFAVTNNSTLYLTKFGAWPTTYQRGATVAVDVGTVPTTPTTGNSVVTLGGEALTVGSVTSLGSGNYRLNCTVPAAIALQHNAGAAYQVQVTVGTETITDGTSRPLTAPAGWSYVATDHTQAVQDNPASVYYVENPAERAAALDKLNGGQYVFENTTDPDAVAVESISAEGYVTLATAPTVDQTFVGYLIEADGTLNPQYTFTLDFAIELAGAVTGAGTATAALDVVSPLAASVAGTGTATAALDAPTSLSASVAGAATVTATLDGDVALAGALAGSATLAADLTVTDSLSGALVGSGLVVLQLDAPVMLAGSLAGSSAANAEFFSPVPFPDLVGTITVRRAAAS